MSRLMRFGPMLIVICCVELIFAAAAPAAEKTPQDTRPSKSPTCRMCARSPISAAKRAPKCG